jgi:hypothetical protein
MKSRSKDSNQYTDFQNMRTCQYDGCNVEWDFKLSGKGSTKYCKIHSIIVRSVKKKMYDRDSYLRKKLLL